MAPHRIVLLTAVFPFAPGEEFLVPELPHWDRPDVQLTIMPWRCTNDLRDVPSRITVDRRLDRLRAEMTWRQRLLELSSPAAWRELFQSIRQGRMGPRSLWRVWTCSAAGSIVARALLELARESGPIDVVYCYWFDFYALGALRARPSVRSVVSRAHGYDLYAQRSPDGRLPFRQWMRERIDLLAPISQDGLAVVKKQWGDEGGCLRVSRLGVAVPSAPCPVPTSDNVIRLLSVSSLTPVKRVDRLIAMLKAWAAEEPQVQLHWTHAGWGPLADELQRQAGVLPDNVHVDWLGHLERDELYKLYVALPWNYIINVSSSEGVPVSLMEAMSHGIPAAATDVGGTGELIGPPGGLLLEPGSTPSQWANQLRADLQKTMQSKWRDGFRAEVAEHWNQDRNLDAFVNEVIRMSLV